MVEGVPQGPVLVGTFFTNTTGSSVPDHLTGEYPGGCGWDTAGPAADPNAIKHLRKAEVVHDRWALFGTLWCLTR